MFDHINSVRIALVIYFLIGGFVLISIWRNVNAPDSLQNTGILLAGLLPALIAVLPYLNSTQLHNEYRLAIFYDEEQKRVLNTGLFDPYSRAYFDLYVGLQPEDLSFRNSTTLNTEETWLSFHKEQGMDLIERLILSTYIKKFYSHWDMKYESYQVPNGTSINGTYGNMDSETVKIWDISKRFTHNKLIQNRWADFGPPSFEVPANSKLFFDIAKNNRKIIINNNECVLTFNIFASSSGIAPSGVWGVIEPRESLIVLEYNVAVDLKYRKYGKNGKNYLQWYENISDEIAKLNWANINEEVERSLLRKLLGKK